MSDQVNQHFNYSNIQTGAHQQSSSTQHRDMLHGDSSEVTDQTSSQWTPHSLQGLPYHHDNQQQLQDGAPSPINPQPNAVLHQHIPPSDRTLPHPQTLSCPSDGIQTSIQQPQESSSLSANSQFTSNLHQTAPLFNSVLPRPPPLIRMELPSLDSSQLCVTVSHLVSHADIPHDQYSTDQKYLYPLLRTREMIYSRGLANTLNFSLSSPTREVSSRPLPSPQTLSCPSDDIQTSIQQSQESSSLSADSHSQFTPNPNGSFRTAYQQLTPSSPQGLQHEPTNQTNMYTWHPTQGMIHSGGSANSVNVTMKTVASQPASTFSETAEQISNQPQLFFHPQASQHISQTGALQQPSSTQHHGMLHGGSSVVTDQTYSTYPVHVLLCRPPYRYTNQQQRRPILYPQALSNSRQHTFPSNGSGQPQSSIQHHDSSPNLLTTGHYSQGTSHPHHNQPPLPHNPHQVQPYRPPPTQTSRYPLHPQPTPSQGVSSQPISPHHPGYSHSPALNTLYERSQYHYQQRDGHHFREQLMYSLCNSSSNTHSGLPPSPVQPYFPNQSGYVESPAQQNLVNLFTSNQSSANLVSVEPTKPHSPSTSQPTTLSADATDSTASSSPMSLDAPDPKRARLSPHSSIAPRALET